MKVDPDFQSPGFLHADTRRDNSLARKSLFGVLLFVVCCLVITAILAGETTQPVGMAAYFINGQMISVGRHNLDLSKPIFLRGAVPVCDSEDALENYSAGNPGDCAVVNSGARASLVGIQSDGMRAPSFQMEMQTQNGIVKGWVDYSSVHN